MMFSCGLLSGDLPRSRVLAALLVLIAAGLRLAPFVFPGAKALNVAAKICIFIVLVASFDLLLGYTGIVSFAHTMFFGIGAYGVAIALSRTGALLGRGGGRGRRGAGGVPGAVAGDRPVQPAGEADLLRHDHPGGGRRSRPWRRSCPTSPAGRTG